MEEYSSASHVNLHNASNALVVEEQVDAVTLDDIVCEHRLNPGLIKIDVEGAETSVLRGGRGCLETFSPVLIVECSDNLLRGMDSSSAELLDEMERLGYRALNVYGGRVSVRSGIEDNLLLVRSTK
jgi:hypothetical protein